MRKSSFRTPGISRCWPVGHSRIARTGRALGESELCAADVEFSQPATTEFPEARQLTTRALERRDGRNRMGLPVRNASQSLAAAQAIPDN